MTPPLPIDEGNVNHILQKLLAATRAGKVSWEEGMDPSTLQVVFKGGMVVLRKNTRGGVMPPAQSGQAVMVVEPPPYSASILAPSSSVIATIAPEHEAGQKFIQEVYEAAWRSALQPDKVLEDIAHEIDDQMRKPQGPSFSN